MADTIQLRRDTAANWVTANPVLADGEIGIETDTRKRKCGNGTTAWNSLSYMFSDDLDAEPTANSHKPVESGGTKAAIDIAAEIGLAALDAIGDADNVPTEESTELVRSGGVWEAIRNNGKGAFDISAYKAVGGVLAKYDDLAQALGTNGANVPAAARKPGMSVCFVLNSDSKYVQYRLMANSFSTAVNDWQTDNYGLYCKTKEYLDIFTGKNRFNKDDSRIKQGYGIKADGMDVEYGFALITHPIPIKEGETLICNYPQTDGGSVYGYARYMDGSKCIGTVIAANNIPYISGAQYVEISCNIWHLSDLMVYLSTEANTHYESYIEDKRIDKTQKEIESSYLKKSFGKNLFNKDSKDNVPNCYIGSKGEIYSNSDYLISHYIPVEGGLTIYSNNSFEANVYAAEYDENYQFISAFVGKSKTLSANAKYLRVSLQKVNIDTAQVEYGSSASPYDPYTDIKQCDDKFQKIVLGKNLFDKNSPDNLIGQCMWDDGTLHPNAYFVTSHYIPVTPGSTIYSNGSFDHNVFSAEYDESKNLISTFLGKSKVLSANTHFVRVAMSTTFIGKEQVEYGDHETEYEPFTEDAKTIALVKEMIPKGKPIGQKRILWLGTSIPCGWSWQIVDIEGAQVGNDYPAMVGILTGHEIINKAVASSRMASAVKTLVTENNPYGFSSGSGEGDIKALMRTIAEQQYIIDNWSAIKSTYGWTYFGDTLSDGEKTAILSLSYENTVIPYLDGTYDAPDIIVIDHGFNDHRDGANLGNVDSMDRQTFYGAYNYLVSIIKKYKRSIKIIQISHYENVVRADLVTQQETIAKQNGVTFCPLCELDGWSIGTTGNVSTYGRWNISTNPQEAAMNWGTWEDNVLAEPVTMTLYNYLCPDGVHPHSDKSGQRNRELAYIISGWLKAILG